MKGLIDSIRKVSKIELLIVFFMILSLGKFVLNKMYEEKVIPSDRIDHIKDVKVNKLRNTDFVEDFNSLEKIIKEASTDYIVNDDMGKKLEEVISSLPSYGDEINKFYSNLRKVTNGRNSDSMLLNPTSALSFSNYTNYKNYFSTKELVDEIAVNKTVALAKIITEESSTQTDVVTGDGFTKEIIEPGKTAYLKIPTFYKWTGNNNSKISDFFYNIKDFQYLIIDIRGNKGGNPKGFVHIMKELTPKPLDTIRYYGLRDNEISKKILNDILSVPDFERLLQDEKREVLTTMPDSFTNVDKELMGKLKYIVKATGKINPSSQYSFKGKIFLLVDKDCENSSDLFAQMAKQTGFATVIGSTTKGDGSDRGEGMYYYSLPNSGLVYRIECAYSLNLDGSSNIVTGTKPDIEVESGKELEYVKNNLLK